MCWAILMPHLQGQGSLGTLTNGPFLSELRLAAISQVQDVGEPTKPSAPTYDSPQPLAQNRVFTLPRFRRVRLAADPGETEGHADVAKEAVSPAIEVKREIKEPTPEQEENKDDSAARRQRQQRQQRVVDAQRGEPPAPCCNWLLDQELIPDLLMVWEACMVRVEDENPISNVGDSSRHLRQSPCAVNLLISSVHILLSHELLTKSVASVTPTPTQSFSYLFGLPPMPFRALEASICPLPLLPSASDLAEGALRPLILDPSASASSLLLRDLHHG